MLWTEIRSWAKKHNYETFREKVKDSSNRYDYYWSKQDDPSVTGLSTSVSKLATDIYNHITNNKFVDYQIEYQLNKEDASFSFKDYGT